ncbi:cell adhesion molecule, putative [Ixodes scapularis]|uniref:Cell adhesion molecule, putative n=1 Tax=Ixodes scapularis TaxID=6945 RepID=B7PK29_IXOSC|nr:cell adhesion molecule, putative [Ixodes scapularis]|eukprot:XP_002409170.1 cell adhesion molecule, putative [Ixodes scapularis]
MPWDYALSPRAASIDCVPRVGGLALPKAGAARSAWNRSAPGMLDRGTLHALVHCQGRDQPQRQIVHAQDPHRRRSDSATFSCTATNPYGKDSGSSRVIIQEVPDPPEDVRIGETTSSVVSLIWTAPYSGNSPITSYAIVYQANGKWSGKHDHEPVRRLSVPGGLTTASVTNLQPLTEYQFKVVANNDIGTSTASKVISVTTNMEAPQEAPSQVSAAALDSNSIKLSWRKPHHDHKNMQISGYYVGYKTQGTSEPFIYKTVEADSKGVKEEFIIGGLQKNTKYAIVVQAFNGQGAGPAADEIVVKTHETDHSPADADRCRNFDAAPVAPPSDSFVSANMSSASVQLRAWSDGGCPIRHFVLQYKQQNSRDWIMVSNYIVPEQQVP